MNILRRVLTPIILIFVVMASSITIVYGQNVITCQPDGFAYILVRPISGPQQTAGGEVIPQAAYVLSLRADDPVGLILPETSEVIVYSDSDLILEAHGVRPDATSDGGYSIVTPFPLFTTSTASEQNIYNSGQIDTLLNCDSSGLKATRKQDVIGGRILDQDAETGNISVQTRRKTLIQNIGDYHTHEMLIIRKPETGVPANILGVASMHFGINEAVFQIVQMGNNPIDLRIPSFTGGKDYLIVGNKAIKVSVFKLPTGLLDISYDIYERAEYINDSGDSLPALLELMRNSAVQIYPYGARKATYNLNAFLQLDMSSSVPPRNFSGNVQPIDGARPRLYTANGQFYNFLQSPVPYETTNSTNGQVVVKITDQQGEQPLFVDWWLIGPTG